MPQHTVTIIKEGRLTKKQAEVAAILEAGDAPKVLGGYDGLRRVETAVEYDADAKVTRITTAWER